jgi:hypothetical protein
VDPWGAQSEGSGSSEPGFESGRGTNENPIQIEEITVTGSRSAGTTSSPPSRTNIYVNTFNPDYLNLGTEIFTTSLDVMDKFSSSDVYTNVGVAVAFGSMISQAGSGEKLDLPLGFIVNDMAKEFDIENLKMSYERGYVPFVNEIEYYNKKYGNENGIVVIVVDENDLNRIKENGVDDIMHERGPAGYIPKDKAEATYYKENKETGEYVKTQGEYIVYFNENDKSNYGVLEIPDR